MSGAHPGPGDQRPLVAAAEAMLTKAPELALVFARRALAIGDAPPPHGDAAHSSADATASGRRHAPDHASAARPGGTDAYAAGSGGRRRAPEPPVGVEQSYGVAGLRGSERGSEHGAADSPYGESRVAGSGGRRRAPEPDSVYGSVGVSDSGPGVAGSGGRRRAPEPDFGVAGGDDRSHVGGEPGYGIAGSSGAADSPERDFAGADSGYGSVGTSDSGRGVAGSGGRRRAPEPDFGVAGGDDRSRVGGEPGYGVAGSSGAADSPYGGSGVAGSGGRRRAAEPDFGVAESAGAAGSGGRRRAPESGGEPGGLQPVHDPLLAAARAVEVSALIKLGRHAEAVAPAISALTGGALTAGAAVRVRTELAACARRSAAPRVALAILRPVLDSEQAPSVRADALVQYAGCLASLNRRRGVEGMLAEADRLLAADQRLDADVRRVRRALVCVRTAAHQRYYGDTRSALAAAREGLALLDRLSDPNVDGGLARPRLFGEMIFALLDTGDRKAATDLATALTAAPVRATSAMAVGMVMLAIATRVHLPAGRTAEGHALLTEAVRLGRRHEVHSLLAEALTTLAEVEEQQGKLDVALECLRAARAAETTHRQAIEQARTLLADTFGTGETLPTEPLTPNQKATKPSSHQPSPHQPSPAPAAPNPPTPQRAPSRATALPAPRAAEDEQQHPTSGTAPFGWRDSHLDPQPARAPEPKPDPHSVAQPAPPSDPLPGSRFEVDADRSSGAPSRHGGSSQPSSQPQHGRSAEPVSGEQRPPGHSPAEAQFDRWPGGRSESLSGAQAEPLSTQLSESEHGRSAEPVSGEQRPSGHSTAEPQFDQRPEGRSESLSGAQTGPLSTQPGEQRPSGHSTAEAQFDRWLGGRSELLSGAQAEPLPAPPSESQYGRSAESLPGEQQASGRPVAEAQLDQWLGARSELLSGAQVEPLSTQSLESQHGRSAESVPGEQRPSGRSTAEAQFDQWSAGRSESLSGAQAAPSPTQPSEEQPDRSSPEAKTSYADLRKSAMDLLRALTSESPRRPFAEQGSGPEATIPVPPEPDDYPTAPEPDDYPTPPEPKEPERTGKRRKPDNPDVPPVPEGRRHRAEPDTAPPRGGRRRKPEPDELAGPGNLDMGTLGSSGSAVYGPQLRSEPIAPPSLALPEPPEPPPSLEPREPLPSFERESSASFERRDPLPSFEREPSASFDRREPSATFEQRESASAERREPSASFDRAEPAPSYERREPRSDAGLAELLAEAMVAYQSGQEAEEPASGRHRHSGDPVDESPDEPLGRWTADGTHG
ncbi:hypothetical protein [Labedaea rhizosphaerae]|uniref:hypothetical protein n=1 Tax=Labedaea rhizosphaerae TaxID=598644 RepID=UPI001060BCEA|nr:hypothetical protein [Labedaea rhizosphaerae]